VEYSTSDHSHPNKNLKPEQNHLDTCDDHLVLLHLPEPNQRVVECYENNSDHLIQRVGR
jgi:hypothetical protein